MDSWWDGLAADKHTVTPEWYSWSADRGSHGSMKKMATLYYVYAVLYLISTLRQLQSISVGNYSDPTVCLGMGLSFMPSNLSCVDCGSNMQPSVNGEQNVSLLHVQLGIGATLYA